MSVDELGLYANRNEHKDFVHNAIQRLSANGCNVYIAVAFFTEANVVEELLARGCRIRLVVRLGFPTNPDALQRLTGKPGVEIRYFTGHAFHPKVYIFGDKVALVGSANLTRSAILTNQEVVVSVDSNDPRLTELTALFGDYWGEAKVLDTEALTKYKSIFQRFEKLQAVADALGQEVLEKLGSFVPSNITRDKTKASKESLFLEDFRKTYQECVSAFNIVRDAYQLSGYRKADPAAIPLRLEIDSFISYVRERKAAGDSWMGTPLRSAVEQQHIIAGIIEEWRSTPWPHFEERIVGENYPRLVHTFSSAASIETASDDELFDALSTLHSFYDRFRFYLGGLPMWKKTFLSANDPKRVRETLAYLVFGKDSIESRMANTIYDARYKLNAFGQANVQELIGWCNREELPIINSRTTKVLRYFGSDVRQL
jgi:HKD family nuclease